MIHLEYFVQLYLVPVDMAHSGRPVQSHPLNPSGDQPMGIYTLFHGRALCSL